MSNSIFPGVRTEFIDSSPPLPSGSARFNFKIGHRDDLTSLLPRAWVIERQSLEFARSPLTGVSRLGGTDPKVLVLAYQAYPGWRGAHPTWELVDGRWRFFKLTEACEADLENLRQLFRSISNLGSLSPSP